MMGLLLEGLNNLLWQKWPGQTDESMTFIVAEVVYRGISMSDVALPSSAARGTTLLLSSNCDSDLLG